jgi:predicted transcriptional regulator
MRDQPNRKPRISLRSPSYVPATKATIPFPVTAGYSRGMTAQRRTIEVDSATAEALEQRATETGLSVSDLLTDLLKRHREPSEASASDLAALDRQWAAIKAGEPTVPHEKVVRWLDTWGTPTFKPWNGR